MANEPARTYPSEMPTLALRETVVFPLTLQPLAITRSVSIESVNRALAADRLVFLSLQTTESDDPGSNDLKHVGTIAAIRQMAKAPNGGVHVIVEGVARGRADLVTRTGLIQGMGTTGQCNGSFSRDLNAFWCPTCPFPAKNPGTGATVQAQLWYRDPLNTSNQKTSLSDAIEFFVAP